MIKAKRSNLYTMRPDEPRKEDRLALLGHPEITGKGKLGVGKKPLSIDPFNGAKLFLCGD
jgi:hypothetical protein